MNKKIIILWLFVLLGQILFLIIFSTYFFSACIDPSGFAPDSDKFGSHFGCGFYFKPLNIIVFKSEWVYRSLILLPTFIGIVITYFIIRKQN